MTIYINNLQDNFSMAEAGIATFGETARVAITSVIVYVILRGRDHPDVYITMIVTKPQQIMPIFIKEQ